MTLCRRVWFGWSCAKAHIKENSILKAIWADICLGLIVYAGENTEGLYLASYMYMYTCFLQLLYADYNMLAFA